MKTKIITLATLTLMSNIVFADDVKSHEQQDDNMMHMGDINGMERCYGVAKAGRNDCGNTRHGCGGDSTVNNSKEDWISMPEGTCEKIVGGLIKKKA